MRSTIVRTVAAGGVLLVAWGCVHTEKVAAVRPGDPALDCEQLRAEFTRLDRVEAEAERNKNAHAGNMGAVVLLWPALVANYMDAEKAERLVRSRRDRLGELYGDRRCNHPDPVVETAAVGLPAPAGTAVLARGTREVTFALPQADTDYQVLLSGGAAETFWWTAKTKAGFVIKSSNPDSTATVDWQIVRP
jgi:hypothetical protein